MKASEVLNRYAAGERDFPRLNLRGQSFKGKDLTGADFSEADIRGADFRNANLRGANFSHAQAGLQHHSAIFLMLISCLVLGLSGFLSGFISLLSLLPLLLQVKLEHQIADYIAMAMLPLFLIIAIRQGIQTGFVVLVSVLAVVLTMAITTIVVKASIAGNFVGAAVYAVGITLALAAVLALVAIIALALVIIAIRCEIELGFLAGIFVILGSIAIASNEDIHGILQKTITIVGTLILLLVSTYISWRSLQGNEKHAIIRQIAIAFSAYGGTSFRQANLTDAKFKEARLKSTDFREANLTCTYWRDAQKLDRVRPGKTYLKNAALRQLLTTGTGQNKNFDYQNFRGINLSGANLENASLIDTDFYQANLQGANLSRAILVRSNFERADLKNANLTGSCIQDWVITESTKLDGIICDYVYLKWVNGDKRDQMPPRGKFKAGAFVTFVRYILETVELYHEKDINPRLALTVLQKMSKDYDEPFDIVALGKKGERVFIQVKVSENIIREDFQDDYYSRYDNDLKLWSGKNYQLPPAVDSFIEKRINQIALERTDDLVFVDATYVAGNYTEIRGEVNMSGDRNINMGSGNYNERIEGNYVQGNYYAPEQKQTLAEAAAEIQQLLTQLQSQGCSPEEAQQQAANDLATKAKDNPTTLGKLVKWGQSLGDTAAQTTVSEAAKEVVKLALRLSGVPLP
jgi:uncharacterized protein YjbI with pentapeptide repeats